MLSLLLTLFHQQHTPDVGASLRYMNIALPLCWSCANREERCQNHTRSYLWRPDLGLLGLRVHLGLAGEVPAIGLAGIPILCDISSAVSAPQHRRPTTLLPDTAPYGEIIRCPSPGNRCSSQGQRHLVSISRSIAPPASSTIATSTSSPASAVLKHPLIESPACTIRQPVY